MSSEFVQNAKGVGFEAKFKVKAWSYVGNILSLFSNSSASAIIHLDPYVHNNLNFDSKSLNTLKNFLYLQDCLDENLKAEGNLDIPSEFDEVVDQLGGYNARIPDHLLLSWIDYNINNLRYTALIPRRFK